MYLERLEIQGFKSFANKTVLHFNRGIAAIVGPNGSGKSNVADAVRWVMGEQSLKLLRGKKSEDVIFSGSDKKARLGMAEVSLVINNEDGTMPIDYPEVVITRQVHRSGENEYYLNTNKVRLQDIILLLAKSNFGQRSYSVIGQGMIESILVASAQDRKEFFDEAAGVRQFQIKKEQAEQKLEHTRENLQQAEMLLQEIEPRLRSLTRQVKRLERREVVEQELRETQKGYYATIWNELIGQLAELNATQAETKLRFDQASRDVRSVQSELEKLESESSREEVFRDLQKEYNRLLDQKNALLQDQAVLKGRLEIEATQAGAADQVWLGKRLIQLKKQASDLADDEAIITTKLGAAQSALEEKRSSQSEILNQFQKLENEVLVARERLESRQPMTLTEVHSYLTTVEQRHREFVDQLSTASTIDDMAKLKKAARDIHQSLSSYVKELAQSAPETNADDVLRLQTQLTNFLQHKDSLVNEINDLVVKVKTLEHEQSTLISRREELDQEVKRLTKELALAEKLVSQPAAAKAAVEQGHGELLTQLIELDQKLRDARVHIEQFNQVEQGKKEQLFALQKQFRDRQHILNTVTQETNDLRVQQARLETRRDDVDREMRSELPEPIQLEIREHSATHANAIPVAEQRDNVNALKHQLELIGGIDENVSEEFTQTNERHDFLRSQSEDLHQAIASLESAIVELEAQIRKQFDESFQLINREFTRYFKMLFKGGSAKLMLNKEELFEEVAEDEFDDDEDEDDEDEDGETAPKPKVKKSIGKVVTGIDIQAIPPGKRVSSINMLSGGEKALTSIALICAIIANNPSPFVVLDEVDAALDEANSIKFAGIIDELAHKTQFITISHNRATMQKASILYGVTMGSDSVSQILSVKMEEAEDVIARHGNR